MDEGIEALKKALAIDDEYTDALQFLNLMYLERAYLAADEQEKRKWQIEADKLSQQALELRKRQEKASPPEDRNPQSPRVWTPEELTSSRPSTARRGKKIRYSILERKDTSYARVKRKVFRVQLNVQGVPSESQVRSVSQKVHEDYGRGLDLFTVFSYLPNMDTQGVAFGIAEWKSGRLDRFSVNKLFAKSRREPEKTRFGLSEAKRRDVYFDLAEAQDRAMNEAIARYPTDPSVSPNWRSNVRKQIALEESLKGRYEGQVGRKYGLSTDQLIKIAVEGATKAWPTPKL